MRQLLLGLLLIVGCLTTDQLNGMRNNISLINSIGVKPELFEPGKISTVENFENSCTFSPDGKKMFFTRNNGLSTINGCNIYVSTIQNGEWSKPVKASFSTGKFDFEPHISTDGEHLYYNRMPVEDEKFEKGIWRLEKSGNKWINPRFFSEGMSLNVSTNGDIYFTDFSDVTNFKIMKMKFADQRYSPPEVVGGEVNSPYFDGHSCISPTGDFILFDSRRNQDKKYNDLYVCFKQDNGSWGKAYPLGEYLGEGFKMTPTLSPDGIYIYYSFKKSIWRVKTTVLDVFKQKEGIGAYLGENHPGTERKLFAPPIFKKTGLFHMLPFFKTGGREVYFTSGYEKPYYFTVTFYLSIKNRVWTEPIEVPIERFLFHRPVLDLDGNKFYANSSTFEKRKQEGAGENPHVFY